jgi:hypothetical protein
MEAGDALCYAQDIMTLWYNQKHQPLDMEIRDEAYLQLHKGYNLLSKISKKLGH